MYRLHLTKIYNYFLICFRSVDERYKNICETAQSHSILSLGISCFQQLPAPANQCEQGDILYLFI